MPHKPGTLMPSSREGGDTRRTGILMALLDTHPVPQTIGKIATRMGVGANVVAIHVPILGGRPYLGAGSSRGRTSRSSSTRC